MLTRNEIKLIQTLNDKKSRQKYNLFLAEGIKIVEELIKSNYIIEKIYLTEDLFPDYKGIKVIITVSELKKISQQKNPNKVLAVCQIPKKNNNFTWNNGLILVLDNINDPGNLGTIIRIADWFGISQIVCSLETVDVYSPKVIQASMASFIRVSVVYEPLERVLPLYTKSIFGTFMTGEDCYISKLPPDGIIVFGNEANGISNSIELLITKRLTIPRYGNTQQTESLNVAMATAILVGEFYSQQIKNI